MFSEFGNQLISNIANWLKLLSITKQLRESFFFHHRNGE